MSEGYVLIAIGNEYLLMVEKLIDTLRKQNDYRDVYVITEPDEDDLYLSCRSDFERYGTIQKICLDQNLPFDHNIFLDSDILCASSTDHVWEWFKSNGQYIQQLGTERTDNPFQMSNLHQYESELGFSIPKVHGGVIYINKTTMDPEFFEWMRNVGFPDYEKILHNHHLSYKGSRPDQEIFSLAHGKFGLKVWEIWDHPVMTVAKETIELPQSHVFFKNVHGPELDEQVPFVHVFKGSYNGSKYNSPHYNELYNQIMNS